MRVLSFSSAVVLTTDKERCSMQPIVHYVFAAAHPSRDGRHARRPQNVQTLLQQGTLWRRFLD
jgi:hypothetical protein